MTTTPADLVARARALLDAATPGPWAQCSWLPKGVMPTPWAYDELPPQDRGPFMSISCSDESDAELIAAAPTLIAELCAAVEELRDELAFRDASDVLHMEGDQS